VRDLPDGKEEGAEKKRMRMIWRNGLTGLIGNDGLNDGRVTRVTRV
jgi:hypothetical protein